MKLRKQLCTCMPIADFHEVSGDYTLWVRYSYRTALGSPAGALPDRRRAGADAHPGEGDGIEDPLPHQGAGGG